MDVAIRFYDLVFKTLEKITQMPGAGSLKRLQNERFHELRQWVLPEFDNYIIFYDESDDKIDVIRVLHGARDIDRILNDET